MKFLVTALITLTMANAAFSSVQCSFEPSPVLSAKELKYAKELLASKGYLETEKSPEVDCHIILKLELNDTVMQGPSPYRESSALVVITNGKGNMVAYGVYGREHHKVNSLSVKKLLKNAIYTLGSAN